MLEAFQALIMAFSSMDRKEGRVQLKNIYHQDERLHISDSGVGVNQYRLL